MSQHLFDREAKNLFEQRVRLITAAGVELPAEVVKLRKQLERFRAFRRDNTVEGPSRRGDCRRRPSLPSPSFSAALACAESGPNRADVFEAVRADVNRKIVRPLRPHATATYARLAADFDTTAQQFTTAVSDYDPEFRADVAVSATDKQRDAWKNASHSASGSSQCCPHCNRRCPGRCRRSRSIGQPGRLARPRRRQPSQRQGSVFAAVRGHGRFASPPGMGGVGSHGKQRQ